jgi:hypothetical protein
MSLEKSTARNLILVFVIIAAAATRFINFGTFSSWSNFTPDRRHGTIWWCLFF